MGSWTPFSPSFSLEWGLALQCAVEARLTLYWRELGRELADPIPETVGYEAVANFAAAVLQSRLLRPVKGSRLNACLLEELL